MLVPRFAVLRCFAKLAEPRWSRREKKHVLLDIIGIVLCAVIAGADDWPKITAFARERHTWLRTFLTLSNGLPSHDLMERVFASLSPQSLQRCFLRWIDGVISPSEENHFAIDGKTLRGSGTATKGEKPLHLVSVWSTQAGLSLGQLAVAKKSNEITAIPILLDMLDLENAWVTIDAMGCQTKIAAKIVAGGGNYALTVKRNQGLLVQDLTAAFAAAEQTNYQGLACSQ